jgi:hypothetical protein
MFCPECKDEFRPGFTRCAACNVDLVDDLTQVKPQGPEKPAPPMSVRMAEYCGFFSVDDARDARDRLREKRIRSDIVIREAPGAPFDEPVEEEYWLRVDASMFKQAAALLDQDQPPEEEEEPSGGGTFRCSECGHTVNAEEAFCAKCGARFDD